MSSTAHAHASLEHFDQVALLIQGEWPDVSPEALAETEGETEKVVELVAGTTEHTRTLVRKQVAELAELAARERRGKDNARDAEIHRLGALLEQLQERTHEVSDYVREKMVGEAKGQIASHPLASLLTALGLGLVLGFVLRSLFGSGRG